MFTKIYGNQILTKIQAQQLIAKYGSPIYLYDAQIIQSKSKLLTKNAYDFHVSYAMKANNNSHILNILRNYNIKYIDVVSPGQIYKALSIGYKPQEILYTQNFISQEEIQYALEKNVVLNIGAVDTLKRFKDKLSGKEIFIRINPQLGAGETYQVITGGAKSKFGIYHDQIDELLKVSLQNNIKIVGIHQHIGSNLKNKDQDIFISTVKYIFQLAPKFTQLKYINIGGGIGIQYFNSKVQDQKEKVMNIERLYNRVRQIRNQYNEQNKKNIQIWIEPGRFLVGDCGILLCRITAKKRTPQKIFYGTDTGFNHLIRPALYGSHHQIYNISRPECQKQIVTVCGNICQCSDNLGVNLNLGGQIGDILCIQNAGAYGYSMSSNYNQRLKPVQILKQGQKFTVIRRRETYEDLIQKI